MESKKLIFSGQIIRESEYVAKDFQNGIIARSDTINECCLDVEDYYRKKFPQYVIEVEFSQKLSVTNFSVFRNVRQYNKKTVYQTQVLNKDVKKEKPVILKSQNDNDVLRKVKARRESFKRVFSTIEIAGESDLFLKGFDECVNTFESILKGE